MKSIRDLLKEAVTIPDIPNTVTLYHGGSMELRQTYRDITGHKAGRSEYGVGLYCTTHYTTALKYSKGKRQMYLVTIEKGTDIDDTMFDIGEVREFVKYYVKGSKKREVLEAIEDNMERMETPTGISGDIFETIILNYDAITSSNTAALRHFLVDNGADYHFTSYNGGGSGSETVCIVINPKKIVSIQVIKSKDVTDNFELSPNFL